jgi:prevent-host-death family protein
MISLNNIRSLTDFKRNTSNYVEQIQLTHMPLVLTVNGKAAVVVQDSESFQAQIDRLQALEAELQELKQATLRQEIAIGLHQLEQGQYTEYTEETLHQLFDEIKTQGRLELKRSA